MENDSTLYVGLDVHKDSITVAFALGAAEVEVVHPKSPPEADCGSTAQVSPHDCLQCLLYPAVHVQHV